MTDPNRWALESIARSLGSMNQDVVYVGGAVAGVLITEIVADAHTGDENVTSYLAKQFADLLNDDNFLGVLPGLVTDTGRGHVVRDRMRRIVAEGD